MIIAIDPGTTHSAVVLFGDKITGRIEENTNIADWLNDISTEFEDAVLAVEMIASYGMPVGKEVFETCVWIGRFIEAWGGITRKVYRKEVKMELCGSNRAKDSNIRQALIDLYGGKDQAIGKKEAPGPLYGFKKDMWAALGVAVTYRALYPEAA